MKGFVTLPTSKALILKDIVSEKMNRVNELLSSEYRLITDERYRIRKKFLFVNYTQIDIKLWKTDHKSRFTRPWFFDEDHYGVELSDMGVNLKELNTLHSIGDEVYLGGALGELALTLLEEVGL